MNQNEKKQLNEDSAGGKKVGSKLMLRVETLRKIKSIASHVGLLVTLMIYTLIGGLVSEPLFSFSYAPLVFTITAVIKLAFIIE